MASIPKSLTASARGQTVRLVFVLVSCACQMAAPVQDAPMGGARYHRSAYLSDVLVGPVPADHANHLLIVELGPDCTDGICIGPRCNSNGCEGPDCDSVSGRCKGDRCISTGCSGTDCDGSDDDEGGDDDDGGTGKCKASTADRGQMDHSHVSTDDQY